MDGGGMVAPGAVAFEVYLDGELAFESGEMTRQEESKLVNLNVTGASTLKIVTKGVGTDGPDDDLGDWCDAKFLTNFKGFQVNFNLYGGSIDGSADDVIQFVASGGRATAPSPAPSREPYSFVGWNTDRFATAALTLANTAINADTTFYAVWTKAAYVDIYSVADAGLKTWQSEKNSNYGSATNMLVRAPANTTTNGQFGQNFTSTSTSDSTDIKTALVRFDITNYKDIAVNSVQLRTAYQGNENGTAPTNITFSCARANWTTSETSVTWSNWNKTVYTGTGLVVAANQIASSSATGTQVNFTVTALWNAKPAADNTISFAITDSSSACDMRLYSKEGGSSNAALRPTLRLYVDAAADYTITYDLNGGSGVAPIQPYLEAGKTFAAASARGLTGPSGKIFKEWNTAADGSGAGYIPGAAVTMPAANLTLYAVWTTDRGIILSVQNHPTSNMIGVVTVRASDLAKSTIVIAAYNASGKLIKIGTFQLDASGGQEQDVATGFLYTGAASVKVFLWDPDFIPLCADKTVF